MPKKHGTEQTKAFRAQFARNLVAAIDDAGVSQGELAERLKARSSTVNDWCRGRSVPGLENLILIATIVRQSVSWLVGDMFHGVDTIEAHQKSLAVRLGGERLRALAEVPDDALLQQVDLLISSAKNSAPDGKKRSAKKRTRK